MIGNGSFRSSPYDEDDTLVAVLEDDFSDAECSPPHGLADSSSDEGR